jgi:hypothetical protein
MPPVFTIGHSTRDALAAALAGERIEYMHEPDLGGRRADPHEIDANARVENGGRRLVYSGAPHPPGPPLPSPPALPGEGGTRHPRGRGRPSPGGMGGDGRGDGGEAPVQGTLFGA